MVRKIKLSIKESKNLKERDKENVKIVKADNTEVRKICAELCTIYADVLEELAK